MKKLLLVLFFIPFTAFAYGRHHRAYQPPPTPPPVTQPVTPSITIGAFNANIGTVQVVFDGWTDSPSCFAGKTTFIYWENYGVSLDSIINGSQDTNIRIFSNSICPNTILALFHEANGNWDSWDGTVAPNSPAKVVLAYQHIHNIIGNKVKYAWVMNNDSVPNIPGNQYSDYWPGSSYVDIVGDDSFNFGGQTFAQVTTGLSKLSTYGKPVWLTSVGSADNQTQFITDMSQVQGVSGILYFDYDVFALSASQLSTFSKI